VVLEPLRSNFWKGPGGFKDGIEVTDEQVPGLRPLPSRSAMRWGRLGRRPWWVGGAS
jgi:hypothetical protein